MTVSTAQSTGGEDFAALLQELARLQAQNRKLRRRVFLLTGSRDYWRGEAERWKWGALHGGQR